MGAAADTCHHAEWKSWRRDAAWLKMPSPTPLLVFLITDARLFFLFCQKTHQADPTGALVVVPPLLCPLTPHICGLVIGLTFYRCDFVLLSLPLTTLQRKVPHFINVCAFITGTEVRLALVGGVHRKERWNGKRQSGGGKRRRGGD